MVKYTVILRKNIGEDSETYGAGTKLYDTIEDGIHERLDIFMDSDEYDKNREVHYDDEYRETFDDGMKMGKLRIWFYKSPESEKESLNTYSMFPVILE